MLPANPVTHWNQVQGRALVRPLQVGEVLRCEDLGRPVPEGRRPLTLPTNLGAFGSMFAKEATLDLMQRVPLADNAQAYTQEVFLENVPLLHLREGALPIWHVTLAVTPEEAALIAAMRKPSLDEGKAGEILIAVGKKK